MDDVSEAVKKVQTAIGPWEKMNEELWEGHNNRQKLHSFLSPSFTSGENVYKNNVNEKL